jgi:hypothetical protein
MKYHVVVAMFGAIRIDTVARICKAFPEKQYPGVMCLDSQHEQSRAIGATMCIAMPEVNHGR